jgi:hypothetical protein
LDDVGGIAAEISTALRERKPRLVSEPNEYGELPKGSWHVAAQQIIVLPVAHQSGTDAYGFLLLGKNPFRLFDAKYCNFLELIGNLLAVRLTETGAKKKRNWTTITSASSVTLRWRRWQSRSSNVS